MTIARPRGILDAGTVPRYRQIEAILRDQIWSGELAAGDQVPTEEELGKMFQVSRPTVRQALRILEQDKLIYREAGRGTFVNDIVEELPTERRVFKLTDLAELDEPIEVRIQRSGTVAARGQVQTALDVAFGEELFYFIRLFWSEGRPFGGAKVHVPMSTGRTLSEQDMTAHRFLKRLGERSGTPVDHIHFSLDAVLADARLSATFQTFPGAPMMSFRRTSFDAGGSPVEYSHMLIRSDLCRIHFELASAPDGGWTSRPHNRR
ncbi:MAG: GntR family transcriptional regulator [Bauldia litoralis]